MTEENRAVASTSLVLPWEAERKARAALRIAPLCPECYAKLYVVTAIDAVGFACWDTINCNFKRLATPNLPLAWQNAATLARAGEGQPQLDKCAAARRQK
jgi:hypothetical protein